MNFDSKYFKHKNLIGLDEVGRGPLAGPVVACGVLFSVSENSKKILRYIASLGVTDSKKLSSRKRIQILNNLSIDVENISSEKIYQNDYFNFVIIELDADYIDQNNILKSSLDAMKICTDKLAAQSNLKQNEIFCLIDGNKQIDLPNSSQETVVKGDSKSILIGLASIIAKEYRDLLMKKYDEKYPNYGFASHAGYPTAKHRSAIEKFGVSPIHRKTFAGVKEYIS